MKKGLFFIVLFSLYLFAGESYHKRQLNFFATINGYTVNFDLITIFLLRGEEITIKTEQSAEHYKILSFKRTFKTISENEWKYKPDPVSDMGYIILKNANEQMKIQYMLLTPLTRVKNGWINGYHIGRYPKKALRGNKLYNKPRGLIEVNSKNKNMLLTPHFKLSQFLCKQVASYPKYIVLREAILYKLEYILEALNRFGYAANTFYVMSGYRTPYYNKKIGNVKYSRHVYGDAADIFVDTNHDQNMDDLNRDGKINFDDVKVLINIVEKMAEQKKYESYIGGLGRYHQNRSHPGFIHTDVRGYKARW